MTDDANPGRENDAAMAQDELAASLGRGTGPGEDVGTGGVGAGGDLAGYVGGASAGSTAAGTDVGGAGTRDGVGGAGGDPGTSEEV